MAARSPLARLRSICVALPEAEERETWDLPTFRIRGTIFAMAPGGGAEVWLKARPGSQAVPVGADPARFLAPPCVGPRGWIGIRLGDGPDWPEVAALVRRSDRLVAPRRLAPPAPVGVRGRASAPAGCGAAPRVSIPEEGCLALRRPVEQKVEAEAGGAVRRRRRLRGDQQRAKRLRHRR